MVKPGPYKNKFFKAKNLYTSPPIHSPLNRIPFILKEPSSSLCSLLFTISETRHQSSKSRYLTHSRLIFFSYFVDSSWQGRITSRINQIRPSVPRPNKKKNNDKNIFLSKFFFIVGNIGFLIKKGIIISFKSENLVTLKSIKFAFFLK